MNYLYELDGERRLADSATADDDDPQYWQGRGPATSHQKS